MTRPAKLALEDGTVFTGLAMGAAGEVFGEVCFNTAMTGYQEILTDPSYRGQIVTMTYPLIGNYGVNSEDLEHAVPALSGFVVREQCRLHSNYRAEGDLESYLAKHNVVGISEIDTRALVRRLRTVGSMRGAISTTDLDDASLVAKVKASPGLVGRDLVREVMSTEVRSWSTELDAWTAAEIRATGPDAAGPHVVCIDFGMKWNIPRHLYSAGYRVTIVPGDRSASAIMDLEPDGVFLSNGPGDPDPLTYAHQSVRDLVGRVPMFGICLGHQMIALACGASAFKLKFGHRGVNQPVLDLKTGRIEITTQNHGFAISEDDLPDCLEVTHRNLNDDTIAGVSHREQPVFGVQYHPEAASGPHDSHYLFRRFGDLMRPVPMPTR